MTPNAGGTSGVRQEATAISRKTLVVNPDHSTAYISKTDAVLEVRDGIADWDHPQRQSILYRRPKLMVGHSAAELEFHDVWQLKASGGIPVWQMRTP